MWNHSYRNAKHPDVMIDYKLVELCMFDSYESFTSDNTSGSYMTPFPFYFLRKHEINGGPKSYVQGF